jgi:hypothetical protein
LKYYSIIPAISIILTYKTKYKILIIFITNYTNNLDVLLPLSIITIVMANKFYMVFTNYKTSLIYVRILYLSYINLRICTHIYIFIWFDYN